MEQKINPLASKEIERLNILVGEQEYKILLLKAENKELQEEHGEWQEDEASVCPEDIGFKEYIKALKNAHIEVKHELDHAPYVVLTNSKGDTYTSYSEELIDFLAQFKSLIK